MHRATSVTLNRSKTNKSSKTKRPSQPTYLIYLFQAFGDDDYDTNDKKRTVQTEKEKKWNAIKALCTKITNQLNNEDFKKVWDSLQ